MRALRRRRRWFSSEFMILPTGLPVSPTSCERNASLHEPAHTSLRKKRLVLFQLQSQAHSPQLGGVYSHLGSNAPAQNRERVSGAPVPRSLYPCWGRAAAAAGAQRHSARSSIGCGVSPNAPSLHTRLDLKSFTAGRPPCIQMMTTMKPLSPRRSDIQASRAVPGQCQGAGDGLSAAEHTVPWVIL